MVARRGGFFFNLLFAASRPEYGPFFPLDPPRVCRHPHKENQEQLLFDVWFSAFPPAGLPVHVNSGYTRHGFQILKTSTTFSMFVAQTDPFGQSFEPNRTRSPQIQVLFQTRARRGTRNPQQYAVFTRFGALFLSAGIQYNYYPSRKPVRRSLSPDSKETVAQDRTLTNAGCGRTSLGEGFTNLKIAATLTTYVFSNLERQASVLGQRAPSV